jgi:hypothetical protein
MTREHKRQGSISGKVTAVFAHRFVVESSDGQFLANIGSDAVGRIGLRRGDKVTLKGKLKPAEIKVTEIEKDAGKPIRIERKKKHGHDERRDYRDPGDAIAAVTREGYEVMGEPRRKPQHFQILGRSANGDFTEFHVGFGGAIRKHKPADIHQPKWQTVIPG